MKRISLAVIGLVAASTLAACQESKNSSQQKDAEAVNRQQEQYAKSQPIPAYDYSLERDLLIQLYDVRNHKVATHSVWRSDLGTIEGDCPSMGYGLPYDTSLTNPLTGLGFDTNDQGSIEDSVIAVGQPEPNGIFASTNTAATWVFCVNAGGVIEPHYVETKVTVYPGPVSIDYDKNRVLRSGEATVTLN
jgi:hypothetical protein